MVSMRLAAQKGQVRPLVCLQNDACSGVVMRLLALAGGGVRPAAGGNAGATDMSIMERGDSAPIKISGKKKGGRISPVALESL
jgi:hypothetical protein